MKSYLRTGLVGAILAVGIGCDGSLDEKVNEEFIRHGVYSTKVNPERYGLKHETNSDIIKKLDIYKDKFAGDGCEFSFFRYDKRFPLDIESCFWDAARTQQEIIQSELKPGEGFGIAGKGKPREITIDGMKGLSGGAVYKFFESTMNFNPLEAKYYKEIDILVTVVGDSNYIYSFNMKSDLNNRKHDGYAKMYDEFISTFRRIK